MALSFIGAATATATNGGNATFNLAAANPSGPSDGDLVVIISGTFGRAGNEGRIGNALSYVPLVDVTATTRLRVAYKVFGSSETAPVVEGSGNTADALVAACIILRGQDASPIDVTSTTANGSSADPDPASITPVSNDCAIITLATSGVNDGGVLAPTNYTRVAQNAAADTNNITTAIAYRILTGGAGSPEDPATFTAWSSGAWVAATVAIRPAGAGAATGGPLVGGFLINRSKLFGGRLVR